MSVETKEQKKRWVKKWEAHKHCLVCSIAIPPDKEFCSTDCESEYLKWKDKQKGKSRNTWICMIVMIVAVVIITFVMMGFGV